MQPDDRSTPATSDGAERVYDALRQQAIPFDVHNHPPVLTVAEAEQYWAQIPAVHCKNLFLRNRKGSQHYLVLLEHTKHTDLKRLAAALGEDILSFASADRLNRYLGLQPGAVSPFGLINDADRSVRVVIDRDLTAADRIGVHPNVNTATVVLSFADLQRFLASCGNAVQYVAI